MEPCFVSPFGRRGAPPLRTPSRRDRKPCDASAPSAPGSSAPRVTAPAPRQLARPARRVFAVHSARSERPGTVRRSREASIRAQSGAAAKRASGHRQAQPRSEHPGTVRRSREASIRAPSSAAGERASRHRQAQPRSEHPGTVRRSRKRPREQPERRHDKALPCGAATSVAAISASALPPRAAGRTRSVAAQRGSKGRSPWSPKAKLSRGEHNAERQRWREIRSRVRRRPARSGCLLGRSRRSGSGAWASSSQSCIMSPGMICVTTRPSGPWPRMPARRDGSTASLPAATT